MMKKLYSIYNLSLFSFCLLAFFVLRAEDVSAISAIFDPVKTKIISQADTSKRQETGFTLKDTRKNKPKIFQDPVKTYDDRQLLFFTTFGFNDYAEGPVAVGDIGIEPEKIISNFKVYPNPLYVSSQSLKISYNIKKNALVTVKMLDVLGNEVSTLFTQRVGAGYKTGEFNISSKVTGGFYFIRLSADSDHVTKKISVVQ